MALRGTESDLLSRTGHSHMHGVTPCTRWRKEGDDNVVCPMGWLTGRMAPAVGGRRRSRDRSGPRGVTSGITMNDVTTFLFHGDSSRGQRTRAPLQRAMQINFNMLGSHIAGQSTAACRVGADLQSVIQ